MKPYEVAVDINPSDEDIETIVSNLMRYNERQAERERWQRIAVFVRDSQGSIVGGLNGYTRWDWLFISHVWVDDDLRGQGYGRILVRKAETEAVQRGCLHSHVDTYDFQARGFYEKLGYKIFGVLEDFPKGHTRYFFQRRNIETVPEHER